MPPKEAAKMITDEADQQHANILMRDYGPEQGKSEVVAMVDVYWAAGPVTKKSQGVRLSCSAGT